MAIFIRSDLDEFIAGLPEVNRAVKGAANDSANRVRAAAPVRTGALKKSVKVVKSGDKDWLVVVSTDYVIPVNYGFFHVFAQREIAGTFFIKAGL